MSIASIQHAVVHCTRCPELRAYCATVAREKKRSYANQDYWGKPVPAFGDPDARVVLVGLAPGAHGSNRTGRMFTGDASGAFLFPALYRAGFASQEFATDRDDGMALRDCIITAAGRCAPPKNKPTPQQLRNCFPYLVEEFAALDQLRVAIALGRIGFEAIVRALTELGYAFESKPVFGHLAEVIARPSTTALRAYARDDKKSAAPDDKLSAARSDALVIPSVAKRSRGTHDVNANAADARSNAADARSNVADARSNVADAPLQSAAGASVIPSVAKRSRGTHDDHAIVVLSSFHPSRQNTNTGKLTVPMFDAVFARARALLDA